MSATREFQAARLHDVMEELLPLYEEWAVCWEVERRAKSAAYETAQSHSLGVTAADHWSYISSTDAAVETLKLTQAIKRLESERDYLQFCLSQGI